MTTRRPLAALAVALLTACGSSPKTHFLALNVVPGAGVASTIPFRVQLAAVHLPPSLDRRQLVRMSGDNTVRISDTERWSAALDDMVRNVLAQDLAERLPRGTVVLPEAPTPTGAGIIVVTLVQFGRDASGDVELAGSWTLVDASSNASILDREVRVDAGPAATAGATAAAMSRALGDLAGEIASGLAQSGVTLRAR